MLDFIFYFFKVASGLTMFLTVGAIILILVCIIEIINRKKILRNIGAIAALTFCYYSGMQLFISDNHEYKKTKSIEAQLGSKLGAEITKSEVIKSKSSGNANEYNMKLFGHKLPSGKTCELRMVRVQERYVGGLYGFMYNVEVLSSPTDC